uniref:F-box domain-containing protein n=1 Tax=Setaria viridis TaxID=4556 RepID=A0A4U6VU18_SETVI|nr:hypothetical protein SEVIR_2G228266v2 [Setaria viridis]
MHRFVIPEISCIALNLQLRCLSCVLGILIIITKKMLVHPNLGAARPRQSFDIRMKTSTKIFRVMIRNPVFLEGEFQFCFLCPKAVHEPKINQPHRPSPDHPTRAHGNGPQRPHSPSPVPTPKQKHKHHWRQSSAAAAPDLPLADATALPPRRRRSRSRSCRPQPTPFGASSLSSGARGGIPATRDLTLEAGHRPPRMPSSLEGGQAQEQENKITLGTYSEGDIAGGCRGSGTDRICGLPDNLLHSIVLRLPGTADAARTSVLARSWRGVWAQLPELMFPPYALTRWSGSRSLVNSRAVFRLQPRSFKHFVHSLCLTFTLLHQNSQRSTGIPAFSLSTTQAAIILQSPGTIFSGW